MNVLSFTKQLIIVQSRYCQSTLLSQNERMCASHLLYMNEMGGACGAYEGGERCAQSSSGGT